jgi:hypothetical protein
MICLSRHTGGRASGCGCRLPGSGALDRVVNIDPAELEAALAGDVASL